MVSPMPPGGNSLSFTTAPVSLLVGTMASILSSAIFIRIAKPLILLAISYSGVFFNLGSPSALIIKFIAASSAEPPGLIGLAAPPSCKPLAIPPVRFSIPPPKAAILGCPPDSCGMVPSGNKPNSTGLGLACPILLAISASMLYRPVGLMVVNGVRATPFCFCASS